MRKVFLIIITALMAIACQKEDAVKTTYTFIATDSVIDDMHDIGERNGFQSSEVSVMISEYYQGQRVATNMINNVVSGKKYTLEANSKTEYVTVRIKCALTNNPSIDDYEFVRYIANVIYLKVGGDTKIDFNNSTIVSSVEP